MRQCAHSTWTIGLLHHQMTAAVVEVWGVAVVVAVLVAVLAGDVVLLVATCQSLGLEVAVPELCV